MEGFNDVWANILNDDILNAKDLLNVPILEQPSELKRLNLNLESNIIEASIESLVNRYDTTEIKPGERILAHLEEELKDETIVLPARLQESDFKDTERCELKNLREKGTSNKLVNVSSIIKESVADSVESKIENLWCHLPKKGKRAERRKHNI